MTRAMMPSQERQRSKRYKLKEFYNDLSEEEKNLFSNINDYKNFLDKINTFVIRDVVMEGVVFIMPGTYSKLVLKSFIPKRKTIDFYSMKQHYLKTGELKYIYYVNVHTGGKVHCVTWNLYSKRIKINIKYKFFLYFKHKKYLFEKLCGQSHW